MGLELRSTDQLSWAIEFRALPSKFHKYAVNSGLFCDFGSCFSILV